jgi:membrane protease YdiL (CAAX protease family)
MSILWLLGVYHVTGMNDWSVLIPTLADDLPSAFVQQLLLLGILFRITEQAVGTWWALLISVLLFGLVHLLTIPHLTVMAMLANLLGGLLFVAAYLQTRSLWLPIALHAALDWTKDGIFGTGVAGTSGTTLDGLLQAHLTGPELLTGGAAGAEASLVTIVVLLAAVLLLLLRAKKQGQLGKPF